MCFPINESLDLSANHGFAVLEKVLWDLRHLNPDFAGALMQGASDSATRYEVMFHAVWL